MKKIVFAWIEQIIDFGTIEEVDHYLDKENRTAARKGQRELYVVSRTYEKNHVRLHVRKPYNQSNMMQEGQT